MHKFLGVKPRVNKHTSCGVCEQLLGKRPFLWWHGMKIHTDCFDKEMNKPLHLRFKKK